MKAPPFAYAKPATLAEMFDLLDRPGAKVLAGGQSLIPTLNMRLSSPELLVDITGLSALRGISMEQGAVRIGALVTHAEIEINSLIKTHLPLLAQAVTHVAHPAIRNRGTIGGSMALADPAAEYPACAVALNAMFILKSKNGERQVAAADFFKGLFETALAPGDIVAAVEFPAIGKNERSVFLELTRRHGDYAIIGLAAHRSSETRLVFFNAGPAPVLVKGNSLEEAKKALARDLDPPADLYNTSSTKRHLAGVLLERAWTTLSKPH